MDTKYLYLNLVRLLSGSISIGLIIAIHHFVKDDLLKTTLIAAAGGLGGGIIIPGPYLDNNKNIRMTSMRPGEK